MSQRTLILGLAREGVSLARYLAERGDSVTVTDSAPAERLSERLQRLQGLPIRTVLGGDHPELISETDAFFVSPGVPEDNPVYRRARDRGLRIQSMTTLFFEMCPGPIVGVTGSSGKTTTTGLLGQILRTAGRHVVVGGNIGDPMLDFLPEVTNTTVVVLELSSFQLAILRRSPHIAVITNISPNHLDRHGTMDAYVAAKANIVLHQTLGDFAILNAADPTTPVLAECTPAGLRLFGCDATDGATIRDGWAGLVRNGQFSPVIALDEIPLLGSHNVQNVLAALATADLLEVSPVDMANAVRAFRPAPHRLETVGERNGVRYIDDSIATSPARASVALQAVQPPVVLVAGGRDKRLPWEEFADLVTHRARALLLIGEAAGPIEQVVRERLTADGTLRSDAIRQCESLEEAVRLASRLAHPGDTVLLSPGCASYDMFADFEERGRVFARTVEALDAA